MLFGMLRSYTKIMSPNRAHKCFFSFLLFKHNIFLLDKAAGFGFEQFYKWFKSTTAKNFLTRSHFTGIKVMEGS